MNNKEYFKTISGFCKVKSDRLLLTKHLNDQNPTKYGHPIIKTTMSGFVHSLIALGFIGMGIQRDFNLVFAIALGIIGLYSLTNSLIDLRYSRQCEIMKDSIININLIRKLPLIRNDRILIKFNENEKQKETKILLPHAMNKDTFSQAKTILKKNDYIK